MTEKLGMKAWLYEFADKPEPYRSVQLFQIRQDMRQAPGVTEHEGRFLTLADLETFARRVIGATEAEMDRYMEDWRHDRVIAELKKEGLL